MIRPLVLGLLAGTALFFGAGEAPAGRWGDPAQLAAGCRNGDGASCELLGLDHVDAGRTSDAYASFLRACDTLRSGNACNWLANYHQQRNQTPEVQRWTILACKQGHAPSCATAKEFEEYAKAAAAAGSQRAAWDAKAQRVTGLLAQGDFAGAMAVAADEMGSRDDAARVLVAAADAGALGRLEDKYFVAFASNWFNGGRPMQIVRSEQARRGMGPDGSINRRGEDAVDRAWRGRSTAGPTGPTLADQVMETNRRQNRENCEAAAKGANRICNPN